MIKPENAIAEALVTKVMGLLESAGLSAGRAELCSLEIDNIGIHEATRLTLHLGGEVYLTIRLSEPKRGKS